MHLQDDDHHGGQLGILGLKDFVHASTFKEQAATPAESELKVAVKAIQRASTMHQKLAVSCRLSQGYRRPISIKLMNYRPKKRVRRFSLDET